MLPVIGYLLVRLVARRSVTVQLRTMLLIAWRPVPLRPVVPRLLPRRPALVGAGGRHLAAQLGRLLRHRDGAGGLQRAPSSSRCGRRRCFAVLGDHPAVSWTIAALVGLSFATFSPPSTPGVFGAEYWVRWFLFGVFSFFLLAPAMFGDQTAGRGRRFLASRPLVLLGTVSLGFYLFHLAFLGKVQEWLAGSGTSAGACRRCSRSPSCARWVWRS